MRFLVSKLPTTIWDYNGGSLSAGLAGGVCKFANDIAAEDGSCFRYRGVVCSKGIKEGIESH